MAILNFPILYINDPTKGRPLFNGQIFVGEPDLDPEVPANQKQLNVVQGNGTVVPVSQPFVLSAGGVPIYQNKTVRLDVDGNYSLKILDKNGAQAYYIHNVLEGAPILVSDGRVIPFDTLNDAVTETNTKKAFIGSAANIKERTTGNGGGAMWDYVDATTVTPNTYGIVACTGIPTLALVLRYTPNNTIDMYGAIGGQNSSDAINAAALNHVGTLKCESSGYILDKQVLIPSGPCTGIVGNGDVDTVFVKAFNGDAIRIQNQATTLDSFWLQCDGSNFTGGGVYVVSDDCEIKARITDSADSCIICQANNAKSLNVESFLTVTDPANFYTIRSDGNDLSTTPTSRRFRVTGGSTGPNFAGMNVARLSNTLCQRIGFDPNSDKVVLVGNRFTTSDNITVYGDAHTFTGNVFGFGPGANLIFDSTCEAVKYDDSNINSINGAANSVVVDNSPTGAVGTTNSISQEFVDWSSNIEWKGATSDGVFGNSTVAASYAKDGRTCNFSFSFIRGSTATLAFGTWSFTLPFKALALASGGMLVKDSSGNWRSATWVVFGGSNQVQITLEGSNGPMDETDIAFSTGGQIQGQLTYQIASV